MMLQAWKRYTPYIKRQTFAGRNYTAYELLAVTGLISLQYDWHDKQCGLERHHYWKTALTRITCTRATFVKLLFQNLKNGQESHHVILTEKHSTHYKAKADQALNVAATMLTEQREAAHSTVVICSDALSVLQAPHNHQN